MRFSGGGWEEEENEREEKTGNNEGKGKDRGGGYKGGVKVYKTEVNKRTKEDREEKRKRT